MATRPLGGLDAPLLLRLGLFGVACGSVYPLLAWVYDVGTFARFTALLGVPLVGVLIATAALLTRTGWWPETRHAIRAGALGGLLGTAGYDLFRVPFVYGLGLGLLAPIDSYGVLLLDADSSSAWTGIAGWSYHTANGIGFGVAYAVLFRGRHWGYGVGWGMVLESAIVFSPFATSYALRGDQGVQWLPVVIAYAAHVPYGLAVGHAGQRAGGVSRGALEMTRRPVLYALAAVAVVLVVWQHPFAPDGRIARGERVAAGPSAVIDGDDWFPMWLRVPVGGCLSLRNDGDVLRRSGEGDPIEPGAVGRRCFDEAGVHRVKVDGQPFSGGFVIVDDQWTGGKG